MLKIEIDSVEDKKNKNGKKEEHVLMNTEVITNRYWEMIIS